MTGERRNLAPWSQPPTFSRLFDMAAATRTVSVDCPIASAVIESLRFELENAQQVVMHLQQELQKARGDDE
jgi:hypothetical protein